MSSNKKKRVTGINFKIYENGDLYVGHLKVGKVEGPGILFFEKPRIRCEGVWQEGLLNGMGRQIGPFKEKYIGEFKNGIKEGRGRFSDKSKTIIGNFKDGELNGLAIVTDSKTEQISKGYFVEGVMQNFGILSSMDNQYHYSGFFRQGVFHGLGEEVIRDSHYMGFFELGHRHGIGVFKDGRNHKYIGSWVQGNKEGFGLERYRSGDYYEGNFNNNIKQGIGRYFHSGDGSIYTGNFVAGLREGFGRLENSDYVYVGYWKTNLRHGLGYQFNKDGRWYYGDWVHNQKSGFGWETQGQYFYKGEWLDDRPHGYALINDSRGKEKFAVFEYGVFKELSVDVPRKLFEYFEAINLEDFMAKMDSSIILSDQTLTENVRFVQKSSFLFKDRIREEREKLKKRVDQSCLDVENMEISFARLMRRLEKELKDNNIDMNKLMSSYNYDIIEERRADSKIVIDANRSLKLKNKVVGSEKIKDFDSHLVDEFRQDFQRVANPRRQTELAQIKKNLEELFESNFEFDYTAPETPGRWVARDTSTSVRVQDKGTETSGLKTKVEVLESKKSEIDEARNLLELEKSELKKRKEEIMMLMHELEVRKRDQVNYMDNPYTAVSEADRSNAAISGRNIRVSQEFRNRNEENKKRVFLSEKKIIGGFNPASGNKKPPEIKDDNEGVESISELVRYQSQASDEDVSVFKDPENPTYQGGLESEVLDIQKQGNADSAVGASGTNPDNPNIFHQTAPDLLFDEDGNTLKGNNRSGVGNQLAETAPANFKPASDRFGDDIPVQEPAHKFSWGPKESSVEVQPQKQESAFDQFWDEHVEQRAPRVRAVALNFEIKDAKIINYVTDSSFIIWNQGMVVEFTVDALDESEGKISRLKKFDEFRILDIEHLGGGRLLLTTLDNKEKEDELLNHRSSKSLRAAAAQNEEVVYRFLDLNFEVYKDYKLKITPRVTTASSHQASPNGPAINPDALKNRLALGYKNRLKVELHKDMESYSRVADEAKVLFFNLKGDIGVLDRFFTPGADNNLEGNLFDPKLENHGLYDLISLIVSQKLKTCYALLKSRFEDGPSQAKSSCFLNFLRLNQHKRASFDLKKLSHNMLYATCLEFLVGEKMVLIGAVNSSVPTQPLNYDGMYPSLNIVSVENNEEVRLISVLDLLELSDGIGVFTVNRAPETNFFVCSTNKKIVLTLYKNNNFEKIKILDFADEMIIQSHFNPDTLTHYTISQKEEAILMIKLSGEAGNNDLSQKIEFEKDLFDASNLELFYKNQLRDGQGSGVQKIQNFEFDLKTNNLIISDKKTLRTVQLNLRTKTLNTLNLVEIEGNKLALIHQKDLIVVHENKTNSLLKLNKEFKVLAKIEGIEGPDTSSVNQEIKYTGSPENCLWVKGNHQCSIVSLETMDELKICGIFGKVDFYDEVVPLKVLVWESQFKMNLLENGAPDDGQNEAIGSPLRLRQGGGLVKWVGEFYRGNSFYLSWKFGEDGDTKWAKISEVIHEAKILFSMDCTKDGRFLLMVVSTDRDQFKGYRYVLSFKFGEMFELVSSRKLEDFSPEFIPKLRRFRDLDKRGSVFSLNLGDKIEIIKVTRKGEISLITVLNDSDSAMTACTGNTLYSINTRFDEISEYRFKSVSNTQN